MRYIPPMADTQKPSALTAQIAAHPGAMVPGVPPFIFSIPAGWVVDEAPGALCVVRTARQVDGFWVNALISHDKVARSVDFEHAAKVTWAKLKKTNPEAEPNGERMVRFGDRVVYVRGVNLNGSDGRPLAQLQAMFFAPTKGGGKVVDYFQVIGTCPRTGTVDEHMEAFLEIVGSFRFV